MVGYRIGERIRRKSSFLGGTIRLILLSHWNIRRQRLQPQEFLLSGDRPTGSPPQTLQLVK